MFNASKALRSLHNKQFSTLRELRESLAQIAQEHRQDLPLEVGPSEMLAVARANGWVYEASDGAISIRVGSFTSAPPAAE